MKQGAVREETFIYFQALVDRDSSSSTEMCSDSSCGVSSSSTSSSTSLNHGTVCLQIKEGKSNEVLSTEDVGNSCSLDEFQSRQKFMEEQNRLKKELLSKVLADRSV